MDEDEMSRLLALAWGVAAAPQRGPRRELSLERIVETAVSLADAEGLQAVTMQRLAQSFGFTTMAMYRYVSSKDDLVQLMLDASVPEHAWAVDDEDWRTGLTQWAHTLGEAYRRHPWALDISLSMEALLMPGQMRAVDAGLRAMRRLPGTSEMKLWVLMVLSVQIRGLAAMNRDLSATGGSVNEETRQLMREIVSEAGLPDVAPLISSGVFFGDPEAGEDDPGVVLNLLLPGIEKILEGSGTADTQPERTPRQRLAEAEAELASAVALRKAAQRRVTDLQKREAQLRAAVARARSEL